MEDENKVQTNNEIDTSQEVDENILAQQPLMAALMSEESAQPPKEEEPVNPVLAPSPVETAPALDTAPVSSEAVPTNQGEEQSQDLSAFQPPSMSPKEEDQEEKNIQTQSILHIITRIRVTGSQETVSSAHSVSRLAFLIINVLWKWQRRCVRQDIASMIRRVSRDS